MKSDRLDMFAYAVFIMIISLITYVFLATMHHS